MSLCATCGSPLPLWRGVWHSAVAPGDEWVAGYACTERIIARRLWGPLAFFSSDDADVERLRQTAYDVLAMDLVSRS